MAKTKTKTKKTSSSSKKTPRAKVKTAASLKKTRAKPRTKKTTLRAAPPSTPPTETNASGSVVADTDPCACGHAPEEHGRDAAHPGSTACIVCEDGDCIAYESDPGAID